MLYKFYNDMLWLILIFEIFKVFRFYRFQSSKDSSDSSIERFIVNSNVRYCVMLKNMKSVYFLWKFLENTDIFPKHENKLYKNILLYFTKILP